MHAASFGVAIDVAERKQQDRNEEGDKGDDPGHCQRGKDGFIAEGLVRENAVVSGNEVEIDGDADDDGEQPEYDAGPHQPLGDDAQFLCEFGAFALPAEAD